MTKEQRKIFMVFLRSEMEAKRIPNDSNLDWIPQVVALARAFKFGYAAAQAVDSHSPTNGG